MNLLFLASSAAGSQALADTPLWLVAPFVLLLLLIAIMPLTPARVKRLWEHYYPWVAVGLGALVVVYYLLLMPGGGATAVHTGREYLSFICLIGSLFVVSGGIHINVGSGARPLANTLLLAAGAVVANVIGTTGASMVMIRPWLRLNKGRISPYHIVFFIFIVSNAGGALTPIGDPPLFLGFLRGIPFFWLIEHVWPQWLFTVGALLAVFYVFDRLNYNRALKQQGAADATGKARVALEGKINLAFLPVIIAAVFIPDGIFPHLREIVMVGAAVMSYYFTPRLVHRNNEFSFGPIKEVGFLFIGIFATMMPALGYIDQHGREFGLKEPVTYYLSAGGLSSVLDNAPTYATFLRLAETTTQADHPGAFAGMAAGADEKEVLAVMRDHDAGRALIIAVSLGAVFFGAMTYIGNGPNFMVKSIADDARVKTPTFFGYVFKYSLPILLPILLLGGWLFLA